MSRISPRPKVYLDDSRIFSFKRIDISEPVLLHDSSPILQNFIKLTLDDGTVINDNGTRVKIIFSDGLLSRL